MEHTGRIAFLVMLILNLTFSPYYARPAQAQEQQDTAHSYVKGCPVNALEITPDLLALFVAQEAIHVQLFESAFSWCVGSMWLLEDDFDESDIPDPWTPATTLGTNLGDEAFIAEVYDVVTVDWTQFDMTQDVRDYAEETDYHFRRGIGLDGHRYYCCNRKV